MKADEKPGKAGEIVALDRADVWHHLSQHKVFENADPLVMVQGKGMRVRDARGNEYLDALSGGVHDNQPESSPAVR